MGFSPTGWKGAMKMPKPMRSGAVIVGSSRLPRHRDASRTFSLPRAGRVVSNAAHVARPDRRHRAPARRCARAGVSGAARRAGCNQSLRAPVRRDERQRGARQRRPHRGFLALRRAHGLQVARPELLQPARLSLRQRPRRAHAAAPGRARRHGSVPRALLRDRVGSRLHLAPRRCLDARTALQRGRLGRPRDGHDEPGARPRRHGMELRPARRERAREPLRRDA